jgi:hypothetical protein
LIGIAPDVATLAALHGAESTGRPLGSDEFIADLERRLRRSLRPGKRGPRPRATAPGETMPLFPALNSAIGKVSCVDGAPLASGFSLMQVGWVRSCVRPVGAAL